MHLFFSWLSEQYLIILFRNEHLFFFIFFSMKKQHKKTKHMTFLPDGNGCNAVQQGRSSGGSEAARRHTASWEHRVHHCWGRAGLLQNGWERPPSTPPPSFLPWLFPHRKLGTEIFTLWPLRNTLPDRRNKELQNFVSDANCQLLKGQTFEMLLQNGVVVVFLFLLRKKERGPNKRKWTDGDEM